MLYVFLGYAIYGTLLNIMRLGYCKYPRLTKRDTDTWSAVELAVLTILIMSSLWWS